MPITRLDYSQANIVIAEATSEPRHIRIDAPRRIYIYTGSDIPDVVDPDQIVLTAYQLHAGALVVGQTRLNELKALIAAPPTPAIGLHLSMSQQIARTSSRVKQARTTMGWSNALMDSVFLAGSVQEP